MRYLESLPLPTCLIHDASACLALALALAAQQQVEKQQKRVAKRQQESQIQACAKQPRDRSFIFQYEEEFKALLEKKGTVVFI